MNDFVALTRPGDYIVTATLMADWKLYQPLTKLTSNAIHVVLYR